MDLEEEDFEDDLSDQYSKTEEEELKNIKKKRIEINKLIHETTKKVIKMKNKKDKEIAISQFVR